MGQSENGCPKRKTGNERKQVTMKNSTNFLFDKLYFGGGKTLKEKRTKEYQEEKKLWFQLFLRSRGEKDDRKVLGGVKK